MSQYIEDYCNYRHGVPESIKDYCNYRHGVPEYRGLLQLEPRCPRIQRPTATRQGVPVYAGLLQYRHGVPEYRGIQQLDKVSQNKEDYCN